MSHLGIFLLTMLPTAAWAADSTEFGDCLVCIALGVLLFAIPAAGFAYMLQGWMRLRYALALIALLAVSLPALNLWMNGAARALQSLIAMLTMTALLAPAIVWGWRTGRRDIAQSRPSQTSFLPEKWN
jgi:hypothetical protein